MLEHEIHFPTLNTDQNSMKYVPFPLTIGEKSHPKALTIGQNDPIKLSTSKYTLNTDLQLEVAILILK